MTARDGNMTSVIISKFANNSNTADIPEQVVDTALTFENTAVINSNSHSISWVNKALGLDILWIAHEGFARAVISYKTLASGTISMVQHWDKFDGAENAPTSAEVIEATKSLVSRAHLLEYLGAYLHVNDLGTMGWVNPEGKVTVFVTEHLKSGATRDHKVKVRTGYKDGKVSISIDDVTPFAFGVISGAFSKIDAGLVHPDMKSLTFDADVFL